MRRSEINRIYTVSPLNYIGGKGRILDQILPYFPQDIDTFVDLFCGGCNVGINTHANHYIYNDNNRQLIGILRMFRNLKATTVVNRIEKIIDQYGLSRTSQHNFAYYGGECMKGVSRYNRESFFRLREDVNNFKKHNYQYYIMLYSLIIFGFNNQLRFNREGQYNLPVGKRDFNDVIKAKFLAFSDTFKAQVPTITRKDFRRFDYNNLTYRDFVYIDPPYLISDATYNEQGGWTEHDEYELLQLLDTLTDRNIRWGLSNVTYHKGKRNEILINWLNQRINLYHTHGINMDYSNSNYQIEGKNSGTLEIFITNF